MKNILEEEGSCKASGINQKFIHFTPEARSRIAKYAAQCRNTAAVKHFAKEFPTVGDSTVHLFMYQAEVKKAGSEEEITQIAKKKKDLLL